MAALIGITAGSRTIRSSSGDVPGYAVLPTYTTMVQRVRAVPVLLVPTSPDVVGAIADRIDGLLLSGGGDVDPARYGGTPHESVYGIDPLRDEFELALARAAQERRLPTLCICRGAQLMNVALGGSLIEDIPSRIPGAADHFVDAAPAARQHPVQITAGSAVARVLGVDRLEVNSIHHQSVDRVAEPLIVTGRAPDGVIEALEPADGAWPMWAVQWHPEYLGPDDGPSRRLFEALVAAGR